MNNNIYESPFSKRYASDEMLYIFSYNNKYKTWRKLWVALAKAQQKAGISITQKQIQDLENNIENIDFLDVEKYEKLLKHEVMAHIEAFANVAPSAKAIIHLGESSAYVIDNADIIIYKQSLELIQKRLISVINTLANFCNNYKNIPTLSYTHFQAAQPTTVGKRASLWLHSLLSDFKNNETLLSNLKLRGVKGTTGTAASFKELLNNNYDAYKLIDQEVCNSMGFSSSYFVTSQTYDRKVDSEIASHITQVALSAHKITNDLRLLQHLKELEEPYKTSQVGSSAMPYKRNPMISERIASLAKFIMSVANTTDLVASSQWLERTLDDSASKRLSLPQMFLSLDSILLLMNNIFANLQVNNKVIEKNLMEELPFMITENILMLHVKNGGNRQTGHEKIRIHSNEAARLIKEQGLPNKLINLILNDQELGITKEQLKDFLEPKKLTGFAIEQTEDFLLNEVNPILQKYNHLIEESEENKF